MAKNIFSINTPIQSSKVNENFTELYAFMDNASGAWQNWTPSWSNFTAGSATIVAKYIQIGKTVSFYLFVTLNSSTMSASPQFTLPVQPSAGYNSGASKSRLFYAQITDAGVNDYGALGSMITDTGKCELVLLNASGTYVQHSQVNSTTPFTWGNGDYFQVTGTYEAA